jgi:hypothetical protein
MNKPITNGQVTRWILLLQEFNITVLDRLGKDNLVADFISRIKNEDDDIPVDDSFPDDIIDLEQVNILFGSSANVIISQIDMETLAPIISTGSSRVPDIQSVGRPFHQRETLFSSKIKPLRYSLLETKPTWMIRRTITM